MARAPKFTATATTTDRTVEVRGREFPASVVTCDCAGCEGVAVLAPRPTVEDLEGRLTRTQLQTALHNLVAQRRLLGYRPA